MLRSIPTLTAAVNAIGTSKSTPRKTGNKRKPVRASTASDDDDEEGIDEMKLYQSQIEQSVTRVSKALRDIDNINMTAPAAGSTKAPEKSNVMQFIDDQADRVKASLPIEYYTRQLNHKRVFRHIIEVDERVDFTAKNWKATMQEYGLLEANGQFVAKDKKADPTPVADKKGPHRKEKYMPKKVEEEDFEYDSDEMERLACHIKDFVKTSLNISEDTTAEDLASTKVAQFKEKCMIQIRAAVKREKAGIAEQVAEANRNIKEFEVVLQAVRKQIEGAEVALKERANTENMIREVVVSRFRASIQTLNEHITAQNDKTSAQNGILESSQSYNMKVKAIYDEMASKRHKADPFVRKRAENLLKGLLKLLDDKEMAIQKNREDLIRANYERIVSNSKQSSAMSEEMRALQAELREVTTNVDNHNNRVQSEKEIFKALAKELKVEVEELDKNLLRNENVLAEHARAERRNTLMVIKTNRRASNGAEAAKVLSNEEYIQKMADQYHSMNGIKTTAVTSRKASVLRNRSHAIESGSDSDGSSSSSDIDAATKRIDVKRRKKKEKLAPLCDKQTEELLNITENEAQRRYLTSQSVQPIAVLHRVDHAAPQDAARAVSVGKDGVGADSAFKITFSILSDSDSDSASDDDAEMVDDVESRKNSRSTEAADSRIGSAVNTVRPTFDGTPPIATPPASSGPTQVAVLSEMSTACYVKLYEAQNLKNPQNNYKSVAPRLQTVKLNSLAIEANVNKGVVNNRRSVFESAKKDRMTKVEKKSAKKHAALTDGMFQFSLLEAAKVVLEVVNRMKALSCIEVIESINIVKELNASVKLYNTLHSDDHCLLTLKYKLHSICVRLVQITYNKSPKVILVGNKKTIFIDCLQLLLSIVAVIMNCTLPFWQITSKDASNVYTGNNFGHDFIEMINKQVIFILLGGHKQLSKESARQTKLKRNTIGPLKDIKVTVRRFSQLLVQNSNMSNSVFADTQDDEFYSPTSIISQLLHVVKNNFTNQQLPELVKAYISILEQEINALVKQININHNNIQSQSNQVVAETYEVEHYIALYLLELFLFITFNTKMIRIEKFNVHIEKIKHYSYHINSNKSAFVLDVPVINVFHFDDFYMNVKYPEIVPCILCINLFKSIVYQDISKRLLLLNISGVNPEKPATARVGSNGGGTPSAAAHDLQYLNVGMPIQAELQMKALARKVHSGEGEGESGPAVKSYAQTYLHQKYQIALPQGVSEGSLMKSTDVLQQQDGEGIKLENVLAVPKSGTQQSSLFFSSEERENLPKTSHEIHQKWIADMRNYAHYLSKQIYKLVWSGVQNNITAGKKSLYRNNQTVLLPERLIYRVLAHVDHIHKIINLFSVHGEDMVSQLDNEYQNCIMNLMLAQRKIFDIIYTITWPLKKKLIYLQNRYSNVLAENINKINKVKELNKCNTQLKHDMEDIQRSIAIMKCDKNTGAGDRRVSQGHVSLLQHSNNMQKLIIDYINSDNTSKLNMYKKKLEMLTSLLYKFKTQHEDLKIHTVSLLNANNSLYKILPEELMRDELIKEIYNINSSTSDLHSVDGNQLHVVDVASSDNINDLSAKLRVIKKNKRKATFSKPAVSASDSVANESGSVASTIQDGNESLNSYLNNPRLFEIIDKYAKQASAVEAMKQAYERGDKFDVRSMDIYDDELGPDEVAELLRQQQQQLEGESDSEHQRRISDKYHGLALAPKLFSFGTRIEAGLIADAALREQVQAVKRKSIAVSGERRSSFLLNVGGHAFHTLNGIGSLPLLDSDVVQNQNAEDAPEPVVQTRRESLNMAGKGVKIAIPDAAPKRFVMSHLRSMPQYVLDEGIKEDRPNFTPLNLAKLLDIQRDLLAKQAHRKSKEQLVLDQIVVFDDELDEAAPVAVVETPAPVAVEIVYDPTAVKKKHYHRHGVGQAPPESSAYKINILPEFSHNIHRRERRMGRDSTTAPVVEEPVVVAEVSIEESKTEENLVVEPLADEEVAVEVPELLPMPTVEQLIDPTDMELEFHFAELAKFEYTLNREVKEIIANAKRQRKEMKSRLPLSAFHQQLLRAHKKYIGFISGDQSALLPEKAPKKKFIDPVTWPIFPKDWHLNVLKLFEDDDRRKQEEDAQLFNSIKVEDVSNLYNTVRAFPVSPKPSPTLNKRKSIVSDSGSVSRRSSVNSNQLSSSRRTSSKHAIVPPPSVPKPSSSPRQAVPDGISTEALASLLSYQHTHSRNSTPYHIPTAGREQDPVKDGEGGDQMTTFPISPPKKPRSSSSYLSPRTNRIG